MRAVCIFGPTASGKSSLALRLAQELNGVIISADSMQIYKKMNIGTAKPSAEEMALVPHRMIDICDPSSPFSVYEYKTLAEKEIRSAVEDKKLPIVVGGTGLYLDALFFNTDFGEFDIDPAIHERLVIRAQNGESSAMLCELEEIDPKCAAPLHERDTKRIIRGLEVYLSTGKTLSHFKEESHRSKSNFDFLKFHLVYSNRENLYERINRRVDLMLEEGLISEIKELYLGGVFSSPTASQAIGYKELLPFILGEKEYGECVSLLKQKTRNYAKRQITWFRRYTDALCITMDEVPDPYGELISKTKEFLKDKER